MRKWFLLSTFVSVSVFVMGCSKQAPEPSVQPEAEVDEEVEVVEEEPAPTRIESTLNQTEVDKVYVVKGQYWYAEDEDTVMMVCYDGNYNIKLDYPPELKGVVKYLSEDDVYDITFRATKFSGEPTETEGELITVNVLEEE